MFRITNEWLVENRTDGGGYNKKQLHVLGISWPPSVGWKTKLIGKEIDSTKAKEFETIARGTKTKEPMVSKQWEDEEVLVLLKRILKNEPLDSITEQHKRTKEDILAKLRQLANDPSFRDKRPIEDIRAFARVCTKEIEDILSTGDSVRQGQPNPEYYVYTDGACSRNGRSNAEAGIGIYFGENDARNVSRRVVGKQSNNTAELTAIRDTYPILEADIRAGSTICIVSDSIYAIRCATSYGEKCAKEGWKKEIPNKELVKELYELFLGKTNVRFQHVLAHTNQTDIHSLGNHGADKLANQAIGLEECPYA